MNNIDSATEPAKGRKLKNSVKGSNQVASKVFRPMQTKKTPKTTKGKIMPKGKRETKILNNILMEKADFDFSMVPPPYCSCTEYPLPMSSTRLGARLASRKMSNGAYGKLLLRLAAEGHDLTHPVDLKDHWARHDTNKFVIIK
ncbi:protein BASIC PENTACYSTEINE7-like [Carya illinoinensis]|uniref:protein BASIC PENTACYSTEINE7-like n=1 Tax=Carya illinoinensis TaxID=32201 RepID=UPI001C720565|nr:protein BASIC PENTACYSTEINE7-like [Carya illinoinensis]